MKKFLLLALFITPVVAFAAPSVKKLGGGSIASSGTITSSGTTKTVTPAKAGTTSVSNAARIGTLRAKKNNIGTTGAITGSAARFPVITAAKTYNSVATVAPVNSGTSTSGCSCNTDAFYDKVEVDAKITDVNSDVVTLNQQIESINNEITNINNSISNADDGRFDAIRTVNPAIARGQEAPEGYVYIWIEEGSSN